MLIVFILIIASLFTVVEGPQIANLIAKSHSFTSPASQLQFNETGLPAGTKWTGTASGQIYLGGSLIENWNTTNATENTGPWTATKPPNAVNFTIYLVIVGNRIYEPTPAAGTDYTPQIGSDQISQYYQNISFHELPPGYTNVITVQVAGIPLIGSFVYANYTAYFTNNVSINQSISTSRAQTQYILPNGTYFFHFNTVTFDKSSYTPFPQQGYFTDYGSNYTLFITYFNSTPGVIYNIIFSPVNLPYGTHFTFYIGTDQYISYGNISLNLTPGVYPIYADYPGFHYNGSATVTIFENHQVVYLNFSKNQYIDPASKEFLGLLEFFNLDYQMFYTIIALVGSLIIAYIVYRRTENTVITLGSSQLPLWIAFIFTLIPIGIPLLMLLIGITILALTGNLRIAEEA